MKYPIKLSLKSEIIPVGLIALTIPLSIYFYVHFPARVATHWSFSGQVDGWSSRGVGAFVIPAVIAGMYLLFLVLPLLDPKRERYAEFQKIYNVFKGAIIGMMFVLYALTGLYNLGFPVKIGEVVPLLVGGLFILIGNYMGKIKNNWFMGIRTPWTLSSENVWNKTHRVGGYLFMLLGLLIAISPLFPEWGAMIILFGGVVVLVFGTMGYSYWLYDKERKAKGAVK